MILFSSVGLWAALTRMDLRLLDLRVMNNGCSLYFQTLWAVNSVRMICFIWWYLGGGMHLKIGRFSGCFCEWLVFCLMYCLLFSYLTLQRALLINRVG